MELLINTLVIIGAYLLGSIPTSVWMGQAFYGIDVRKEGSGNAGASNTFRILGKKAGIPVLLIDIAKGWTASNLAYFIIYFRPGTEEFMNAQLYLGLIAVFGHIFPIYANFKGGKGIATLLGVVMAIHFLGALCCFCIFTVLLLLTRYVSLSSMIASVSFPIILAFGFKTSYPTLIGFGVFVAIMVLLTHQKNIQRLIKGEESKANLTVKRKKNLA